MLLRERRPMPAAQQLLRAAGPCRVLSDADVVALTAGLDASERSCAVTFDTVPEGGATTVSPLKGMVTTTMPPRVSPSCGYLFALPDFGDLKSEDTPLPPSAPLPSLISAFSRRRALFGAVVLAATPAMSLPAMAAPTAADAEIIDLAGRIKQLSVECDTLTDQRATIEDRVMTEGPRRPEPSPKPPSRTNIVHHDTATERVTVVSMPLDPDPVETEWERARDAAKEAFDRDRTAMEESLGLPEVCGRLDRNWMRLQQSAADLAEMEPRTSAGLAAKAAALMSIDSVGGIDDLGVDLAFSIATDAVRLCGMGGARV